MGVRGIDELLTVLPSAAAEPAAAVAAALSELQAVRHAALRPEEVLALGEVFERFTAQVASGEAGGVGGDGCPGRRDPESEVGEAGAVFACHALGQRRWVARRDGLWAGLLRRRSEICLRSGPPSLPGTSPLPTSKSRLRTHKELGPAVREVLMGCRIPDGDDDITDQLRIALAGLSDAFTTRVRLIRVVDAVLAHYARRFTVTELEAIAKRIVAMLKPPDSKGAHEQPVPAHVATARRQVGGQVLLRAGPGSTAQAGSGRVLRTQARQGHRRRRRGAPDPRCSRPGRPADGRS